MLQQTRAETVIPYYRRWMRRFPTLPALAAASDGDVLRLWEGLGYYRRAIALRDGARQVVRENRGRLPREMAALLQLPGVGPYTAAAVAALAFDRDEIAMDGNLRRVLARLTDLKIDPKQPEGERRLRTYARGLLPSGRAADFNQALMDLGALVCAPREPHCGVCPLAAFCLARRRGVERMRPVGARPRPVPRRVAVVGVVRRGERVLLARRPPGGLLGGLWEFPGGKRRVGETLDACLRRELKEELGISATVGRRLGNVRHAYSHFEVIVHAFECRLRRGEPSALEHGAVRWVHPARLSRYPMGKVARTIARAVSSPIDRWPAVGTRGEPKRSEAA
jgi:A/G-specific adenine glycosylase